MLFQHGILYVATEAYVGNANNPSWPNGLVMAMNDQRQATTVCAGRSFESPHYPEWAMCAKFPKLCLPKQLWPAFDRSLP
jgi:hypothetical protein